MIPTRKFRHMSSPVLFPLSCNSTVRYLTKTEKPQIKKKRSIKGTRSPFLEFHAVSHLIIKQPKYNLQKHRRCCVCAKTFGGGSFSPACLPAAVKHSPFVVSSSMGCLKRVMSLNVQRNRTTLSFSFLMGATCM